MSTSSILVGQKKLIGDAQASTTVSSDQINFSSIKGKALLSATWHHLLDMVVSCIVIFSLLTLYIQSGMHAWWSSAITAYLKSH